MIFFEADNMTESTDYSAMRHGKTETAYLKSLSAKLDNYISIHEEWDKKRMLVNAFGSKLGE